MGSTVAQSLMLNEQNTNVPHVGNQVPAVANDSEESIPSLAPQLKAVGGMTLFGCALLIAFKIVTLDANHLLKEPTIDLTICGIIAVIGLAISWVNLGASHQLRSPKALTAAEVDSALAAAMAVVSTPNADQRSKHSSPASQQQLQRVG
ncbi:MAG TPA: hypothetical protein VKT29_16775 [Terriglobales bacterium]|nr:hypothetical protein [Terriglobales bacterium]